MTAIWIQNEREEMAGPVKYKVGILMLREDADGNDITLRDKVALLKAINSDWDKVSGFVQGCADAYATSVGKTNLVGKVADSWDWTEFFEFLKWLVPLLLQFLVV